MSHVLCWHEYLDLEKITLEMERFFWYDKVIMEAGKAVAAVESGYDYKRFYIGRRCVCGYIYISHLGRTAPSM